MEAVPQRSCSGPAEAARFFQRAGALLYLVEYLRGVDFHAGNLVAAGSQPVLIDCETLLHRDTPLPPHCRNEEHSLLRTGMVPLAPLRKAQESVSALGGPLGGEHRVVLGGKAVQAAEFADALIAGYRGMDIFFDNNRKAFRAIERLVKEFRVASSRLIYRPTQQYFAIVERCLSANLLSSERKWSSFLQSACRAQSIIPKSVIDQEIACLRECEIPVFRGRPCCPARPSKKTVDRNAALLRILLSSVSQSAN
jgi:lantibiotic modifying enzyme